MKPLSKREEFAKAAMQAMIGNAHLTASWTEKNLSVEDIQQLIVDESYEMADAMIRKLKNEKSSGMRKE